MKKNEKKRMLTLYTVVTYAHFQGSPAIHRAQIIAAQFTAHNSRRVIHHTQFTAHNSPRTIHRAQFIAYYLPRKNKKSAR
jgi:hypothetical protein